MERRKSRKRPQESHRQSLMDTSHTTKGLGRMRREISKSRPSHAEMKSKKKKGCSKPSLLRPLSTPHCHSIKGCSPAAASGFMPLSNPLLDTARDRSSQGEPWSREAKLCRFSRALAASIVGTSRLGSSAGWMSGFEAAVCGMGRLCFRCQKIPQPAKTLSLQLQIDGCKTRPDKATSV